MLCVFAIVMGKWLAWEGLQLFGAVFLPIVLLSGSLPWVASGFCCLADVVWCVFRPVLRMGAVPGFPWCGRVMPLRAILRGALWLGVHPNICICQLQLSAKF